MRIQGIILMAVILLLGAVVTTPQQLEHAPTDAQCQADERLWLSKLEHDHGVDDVKFKTIEAWQYQMRDCKEVDPPNSNKYLNVITEAEAETQDS